MPRLLTPKDAAEVIGVSESLVYEWCRRKVLVHYRFGVGGKGGKIQIAAEDLAAFVRSCRIDDDGSDDDSEPMKHIR